MRRTLTWLVMLPFAAVSVLVGHAVAYRAMGIPTGGLHGYLTHAPQVVLVLATLALLDLAVDSRARRRSPLPLASLAIVAFVAQEHVERLVHTGQLPFLLTSPLLWLGIALQIPVAIAVWIVARRLAEEIAAPLPRSPPRISRLATLLTVTVGQPVTTVAAAAHPGRGPPIAS